MHHINLLRRPAVPTVDVWTRCPWCGIVKVLVLDRQALERWKAGVLIQNAFPFMSANNRERLRTGLCPRCYPGSRGW